MTIFRFSLLTAAIAATLSVSAASQEGVRADRILTTKDLHGHCSASEATAAGRLSIGYCLGTITGIADAAMTLNAVHLGKQTICLESDDTAEDMRLRFLMFLENSPDTMDLPAATVVIAVLQSSYPCEAQE